MLICCKVWLDDDWFWDGRKKGDICQKIIHLLYVFLTG